MKAELMRAILRCLLQCDGVPMPEAALVGAVQGLVRHRNPTGSDVAGALKEVEDAGWVIGVSDELVGKSWSLTEKGTHRARKL